MNLNKNRVISVNGNNFMLQADGTTMPFLRCTSGYLDGDDFIRLGKKLKKWGKKLKKAEGEE